jgi:hypothetical protein
MGLYKLQNGVFIVQVGKIFFRFPPYIFVKKSNKNVIFLSKIKFVFLDFRIKNVGLKFLLKIV